MNRVSLILVAASCLAGITLAGEGELTDPITGVAVPRGDGWTASPPSPPVINSTIFHHTHLQIEGTVFQVERGAAELTSIADRLDRSYEERLEAGQRMERTRDARGESYLLREHRLLSGPACERTLVVLYVERPADVVVIQYSSAGLLSPIQAEAITRHLQQVRIPGADGKGDAAVCVVKGAPEYVEDPVHAWAVGSWWELRYTYEGAGRRLESETRRTVVRRSPTSYELEIRTVHLTPRRREFPAERRTFDRWTLKSPDPMPEVARGEEELTTGGVELRCRWREMKLVRTDVELIVRQWESDEVPGGTVKYLMTVSGSHARTETVVLLGFEGKRAE